MNHEIEQGSPEHWAKEDPSLVALVDGDRTVTYGEWNQSANRVADALLARGLKPGDKLGMRFRLGIEWFILQRALQKIDVAQVAVNWKLTAAEAAYILSDCGAIGLACDDADPTPWTAQDIGLLITVGEEADVSNIRLEDLLDEGKQIERNGPLRPNMVLYTSGTTGKPKGVPAGSRNTDDMDRLFKYAAAVISNPPITPKSVSLLTLPAHHGAGPLVAAMICNAGGTVVILDPYDPEEALRLIEKHRIDFWSTVPTMLLRIQALPQEVLEKYNTSSIATLSCGAAVVPFSLKKWIVARFGTTVLWEAYGTSETSMVSFMRPEDQLTKPGSSGRPIEGVDVAIVDGDWNRMPTGETGEIAVNSPVGLSAYVGQEPLGEEVLKDGFYRTGDVGRLDADGFLFITDRIKDMIVAGGVNIYPAEIENALVAHPEIENAAVVGIPDGDFGEKPMAFVVLAGQSVLQEADILAFLDGEIASFKKPRAFQFLDALPLNPMGKILKTELREPYWRNQERNV